MIRFLKKIFWQLNLLLTFLFTKVALTQAEGVDRLHQRLDRVAGEANLSQTEADPRRIIFNIVVIALGFLGLFFLISIIYAGFRWMTSGGNEENISKAKARLKNSIIGLVIIFISYAIVAYVADVLYKATCTGSSGIEGYYCPPPTRPYWR